MAEEEKEWKPSDAFERAAHPVVDEMLDAVLASIRKELAESQGIPGVHSPATYNPTRVALAVTVGIGIAIPFIVKIVEAYRAELDSQEEKS
jgi:hypothetical protein